MLSVKIYDYYDYDYAIYMSTKKKATTLPVVNHVRDRFVREDGDNGSRERGENGEILEDEQVTEGLQTTPRGGRGLSRFAGFFIRIFKLFVDFNKNIYMVNIPLIC